MNQTTQKPVQTLQELAQNLRTDCYYFACAHSAGDTLRTVSLRKALEKKWKGKIVFIIASNHKVILDMFEIKDYIICEKSIIKIFAFQQNCYISSFAVVPTFGKIYDPYLDYDLHKFYALETLDYDIQAFALPLSTKRELPTKIPKIDKNLKTKIETIAPLDKIILFCPEAYSYPKLPPIIFKDECEKLLQQDYKIIANTTLYKQQYLKFFTDGVYNLNLSLKDIIALSISCAGVIVARSGFCEIIAPYCKNLKIYYTAFDCRLLYDETLSSKERLFIADVPIYKAFLFLSFNNKELYKLSLPLKLYNRYIVKGFFKRLRTPFTIYFKLYKKHKTNKANEIKQKIMQVSDISEAEFETIFNEIKNTYEFRLGLLLQKACENFWRGGFLAFPFAYLKLRKKKDTLQRISEII